MSGFGRLAIFSVRVFSNFPPFRTQVFPSSSSFLWPQKSRVSTLTNPNFLRPLKLPVCALFYVLIFVHFKPSEFSDSNRRISAFCRFCGGVLENKETPAVNGFRWFSAVLAQRPFKSRQGGGLNRRYAKLLHFGLSIFFGTPQRRRHFIQGEKRLLPGGHCKRQLCAHERGIEGEAAIQTVPNNLRHRYPRWYRGIVTPQTQFRPCAHTWADELLSTPRSAWSCPKYPRCSPHHVR